MKIYLEDSYVKEFEARVVSVNDKVVVLDKTAFYPRGGGQPADTGKLVKNEEYEVVNVKKDGDGVVVHLVDKEGLEEGDVVKGVINWSRRYKLMQYHTASHVLSGLLYKELGAKITGNQIDEDKLRLDFNLEEFDKEILKEYVVKTNRELRKNHVVKIYEIPRVEAEKDSSLVKLAGALPPSIEMLRIVEVGDVDKQADGGTHVRNTSEIPDLNFLKADNKGKSNRRLYVSFV